MARQSLFPEAGEIGYVLRFYIYYLGALHYLDYWPGAHKDLICSAGMNHEDIMAAIKAWQVEPGYAIDRGKSAILTYQVFARNGNNYSPATRRVFLKRPIRRNPLTNKFVWPAEPLLQAAN